MSWMDSWSRPTKSSATPPPLYLTDPNTKYCLSCGRMISDRKSHHSKKPSKSNASTNAKDGQQSANEVKYCSDGCRKRRLNPQDKRIDRAILALLDGEPESGIEGIDVESRRKKGDHRNLIATDEIEHVVFGRSKPTKTMPSPAEDDADADEEVIDPYEQPDQASMDSIGNRPNPTGPGSAETQREGQKRADEREAVRRAARRAVVFGFAARSDGGDAVGGGEQGSADVVARRKAEAVMNGQVVEPSYAKGNWFVRWRE